MSKPSTITLDAVLESLWHRYLAQLAACRKACTEANVHDLRVAMRRLASGFALSNRVARDAWSRKMRRVFKRQVSCLADLRDTQMMCETANLACERLPQLEPLIKHLRRREQRQSRALRKQLKTFREDGFAVGLAKARARFEAMDDGAFADTVLAAVDRAYRKVCQRLASVDPASVASLHRTRIAFRRFRYALESIQPLFPIVIPASRLSGLPRYQARIGAIQDTEVFLGMLGSLAPQEATLREAKHHFARRRGRLIAEFLKHRNDLDAFWRASPAEAFPWEAPREAGGASSPAAVTPAQADRTSGRSPRHTTRPADRRSRSGRSSVEPPLDALPPSR